MAPGGVCWILSRTTNLCSHIRSIMRYAERWMGCVDEREAFRASHPYFIERTAGGSA